MKCCANAPLSGVNRVIRLVVSLAALLAGLSVAAPASAQDAPPVNSPDLDQLIAELTPFRCPDLPSMTPDALRPLTTIAGVDSGGVLTPPTTLRIRCNYRPTADLTAGLAAIVFDFSIRIANGEVPCSEESVRDLSNGLTMTNLYARPGFDIRVGYLLEAAALAVVPALEAEVVPSYEVQVAALEPFAAPCVVELAPEPEPAPVEEPPVVAGIAVPCPEIVGLTLTETIPTEDQGFFRAGCLYDIGVDGDRAQISVTWATAASAPAAIAANCFEAAPAVRQRAGNNSAEGRAAAVVWFTSSFDPALAASVSSAADGLLPIVSEQAAPCDAVGVVSFAAPLPPYLAEAFAPGRIDGEPITREPIIAPTSSEAGPAEVTGDDGQAVETAATTDGASGSEALPTVPNESNSGLGTSVLRGVAVVLLVLSILGVALALLLMRRRSRVRPGFDAARLVIVLVVAVVSMVLLSSGAPVVAVAVALVGGAVIGYLQGSNLDLTVVGDTVFATRSRWALLAFVAGLVVTQVAGVLDRTGAITVGLALCFLSAAMIGGLIAGRSPKLADAHRAGTVAAIVVIISAVALAAAVPGGQGEARAGEDRTQAEEEDESPADQEVQPADPTIDVSVSCRTTEIGERCAATEHLIGLVDWTQVEFRGGIYSQSDKPPLVMSVAPMLDSLPEPVSQTLAWTSQPPPAAAANQLAITESIVFEPAADGSCCSLVYTGDGTNDGAPTVVTGRLHDLVTVGAPFTSLDAIPIGGNVGGLPFSAEADYGFGEATTCVRYVAGSPSTSDQNAELTSFSINGENRLGDELFTREVALAQMTIPCDIPGFSMSDAMAMLPALPAQRTTGCPTRQELVSAVTEGGLDVTATETVGEMFLTPNDELCAQGSLVSPMQFGGDRPGATRSELMFEYGAADSVSLWADDSSLYSALSPLPPSVAECAIGETGAPVLIESDEQRCFSRTFHQVQDGWVSISYDNQLADGPNTTVRANLPWGSYRYRCHHCSPGDPEISRFLGQFNDFSSNWTESLRAAADAAAVSDATTAASVETDNGALSGTDAVEPDPDDDAEVSTTDDNDDDGASDVALVALVGLLGSMGLAGTALAESGLTAGEVASRLRENGLGGLDSALDDDVEPGVVDEYGDTLEPDGDGLYTWDDGDTRRQVGRAELENLIDQAERAATATAVDEAARVAEHERFSDEHWQRLRDRVRRETSQEMSASELADTTRTRLTRRGERLQDIVERMADTPLRDRMLDFFEREPSPSDADFLALREIMRQQESDQRIIDALGDQSELSMALEGTQHSIARIAEMAGQPGLAMIVRNPSVPARLGVAYATGGFSEIALAPFDLYHALDAKADAVLDAENRDLTTTEVVGEIAQAVVIEYLGARLGGAGAEPPPTPRRPMDLLPENYLLQVKPGQKIPLLHQTGYTPRHVQRLTAFAERRGVVPGARTANQYSAAHIRTGRAIPKPLDIKPKTLSELDVHLGAKPEHLGTVGFFEPTMPDTSKMSNELAAQVRRRFDHRMGEQAKYLDEIEANKDLVIRDGRVLDATTGKAFAGDMDLVYLRDAETGEVITGQRYVELRNEMIEEGLIEHGAEFNIHADLTEGLTPGSPEYRAAIDQADGIATNVLMPTHIDGAPIMEIRNGAVVRGEDIFMLPINR